MIPMRFINEWRNHAPWQNSDYIEQDLVISRALIAIYKQPALQKTLAFRGGTALNKLFFKPATRYSEDIDLVQINAEPIGDTFDKLRGVLDSWLGEPKRSLKNGRANLYYRFLSEENPAVSMRLKIEINTREHFSVYDFEKIPLAIDSQWFTGQADIVTFSFNELLATKLRALYSRKKGRDLYDLFRASDVEEFNADLLLTAFDKYIASEGRTISRAQFEENLFYKLNDPTFREDMNLLLPSSAKFNIETAYSSVKENIIEHIPGEPWANLPGVENNKAKS